MGLFEKRRARNFFQFLQNWSDEDPATHQGINLDTDSMKTIYEKFVSNPVPKTSSDMPWPFTLMTIISRKSHGQLTIVLSSTPLPWHVRQITLYLSALRLGELPQAFARLSAIYGGTYMLDKAVDEIVTDSDGKFVVSGVVTRQSKPKQVIGDPSYFGAGKEDSSGKVRVLEEGKVVRAICILKHPIPGTEDSDSCQIIIPQNQVKREMVRKALLFKPLAS